LCCCLVQVGFLLAFYNRELTEPGIQNFMGKKRVHLACLAGPKVAVKALFYCFFFFFGGIFE
jgi:hypothetical protein